jgi:hypothetical protein
MLAGGLRRKKFRKKKAANPLIPSSINVADCNPMPLAEPLQSLTLQLEICLADIDNIIN